MVSACMSGTPGSGVLSSTGDVLVRGVGGVFDMCLCFGCGGVGGVGGEWVGGLDQGRERWGAIVVVFEHIVCKHILAHLEDHKI